MLGETASGGETGPVNVVRIVYFDLFVNLLLNQFSFRIILFRDNAGAS